MLKLSKMSGIPCTASTSTRTVQYLDLTTNSEDSQSDRVQPGSGQCIQCMKHFSVPLTSTTATSKPTHCDLCKNQNNKSDGVICQIKVYTDDKIARKSKESSPQNLTIKHTFKCHVCGRLFLSNKDLEIHIYVQENKHSSQCLICYKEYNRSCHLNLHTKINSGLKTCLCRICNKQFFFLKDLTKHKKIHPVVKLYSCDECPRKFAAQNHLNLHARVHKPDDLYACDLCPQRFGSNHNLALHMRSHSQYRVECDVCSESFNNRTLLYAHKVVHGLDLTADGEDEPITAEISELENGTVKPEIEIKSYQCDVCQKQYKSKESLRIHRRIHNVNNKKGNQYVCEICNMAISNANNLLRHKKNIHKDYYKDILYCKTCMKVFENSDLLTEHLKSHTNYRCKLCDKRFRFNKRLLHHLLVKHRVKHNQNGDFNDKSCSASADKTTKNPDVKIMEELSNPEQKIYGNTSPTGSIIEVD